jgi:predicted dehydrogenase
MKQTKKRIYTVAIIGCGRIASLLEDDPLRGKPASHAGAYKACQKTRVVAGCDTNPSRLAAFGKRWRIKNLYADHKDLLREIKPDIVSVAVSTENHARIVIDSAEAGVKGIYCEKPISVNIKNGREMIKACAINNVPILVGHERRFDGRFAIAKKIVESGRYGPLKSMTGYCLSGGWPKLSRKKYGGGPPLHDGTHMADLFCYFAGAPKIVAGSEERPYGTRYVENSLNGRIEFDNGVTAFFIGGGQRKYFHFELDIQTESARFVIGNHGEAFYASEKSRRFTGFTELTQKPFPVHDSLNPFVGAVEALIDEIETGVKSVSTGYDALRAMEIIFGIYRSAKNGGEPVRLRVK